MSIELSKFYLIDKYPLTVSLFHTGLIIVFFSSLYPWFLWIISPVYMILGSIFIFAAMLVDLTLQKPFFTRKDFLLPLIVSLALLYYQAFINKGNFLGLIANFFHAFIFFSIFRYDTKMLKQVSTILSKVMAIILIPSIFFFILYILGVPLPSRDLQFGDAFYTFSNYYFFLIDDRQLLVFIPRFQSVFLEPAHLASACAVLLLSQRNQWRKWYNTTMLFAIFLSFSLGGYVYLVVIIFLNLWTNKKNILPKILIISSIIVTIVIGSFLYHQGDNLINKLILTRLEVNDGEMAGNQRVTAEFEADYQNFLESSDIIFGRDKENEVGDSGYKVYFYDNGIVGLLFLWGLYISAFYHAKNKRAMFSALFIAFLLFYVDAFMLWYCRFIPLFCTAYIDGEDNYIIESHLTE